MREMIERMMRQTLAPHIDEIAALHDELDDLHRRMNNITRIGTVTDVDPAAGLCRVAHGECLSPFIKYFNPAAGETSATRHPSVGEQCLLLNYAAGTSSAQSMALCGLHADAFPPASTDAHIERRTYSDGTQQEYDAKAHRARFAVGVNQVALDREAITITLTDSTSIDARAESLTLTVGGPGAASIEATPSAITLKVGATALILDASGVTAPAMTSGGQPVMTDPTPLPETPT